MPETFGWSLSTDHGVNLSADELVGALAAHHQGVVVTWETLAASQWEAPSRNTAWTVHETSRHMADVMVAMTAQTCGEPWPFESVPFDPNSTPELWLARSDGESPARTIERFVDAAPRLRERVGERMVAGDDGTAGTPYGEAHWTMSVVHTFWDTWLHQRDIALPLAMEAATTPPEQRLAALYGLLMAVVPTLRTERPFETTVRMVGPVETVVVATHEAGTITSRECAATDDALTGELGEAVDALSGRGVAVSDALPGAPDQLAVLAGFLSS